MIGSSLSDGIIERVLELPLLVLEPVPDLLEYRESLNILLRASASALTLFHQKV